MHNNKTRAIIQVFGWEALAHLLYSLDLAASCFHLFLLISIALHIATFNNDIELRVWLEICKSPKTGYSYRQGIVIFVEEGKSYRQQRGLYC